MNSTKLFLDETYELDGVIVSGQQLKDAIIDSIILKDIKADGDSE